MFKKGGVSVENRNETFFNNVFLGLKVKFLIQVFVVVICYQFTNIKK